MYTTAQNANRPTTLPLARGTYACCGGVTFEADSYQGVARMHTEYHAQRPAQQAA